MESAMNHAGMIKKYVSIIVLGTYIAACTTATEQIVQEEKKLVSIAIKGAPDWVNTGSAIVNIKDSRLFLGVGYAPPMGDYPMQKASADDMARAEVARLLALYHDRLVKAYMATGNAGGAEASAQSISHQMQSIMQANMAGTRIIRSWRDPKSATMWSTAELEMDNLKKTMANISDMNVDLKRYIEMNADNIFDSMVKE
jgi:hypothetical protein